jgi:hypothetical protein
MSLRTAVSWQVERGIAKGSMRWPHGQRLPEASMLMRENVSSWHLVDIDATQSHVCFEG